MLKKIQNDLNTKELETMLLNFLNLYVSGSMQNILTKSLTKFYLRRRITAQ